MKGGYKRRLVLPSYERRLTRGESGGGLCCGLRRRTDKGKGQAAAHAIVQGGDRGWKEEDIEEKRGEVRRRV
ncbi:hypothetical protein AMTR_s00076p00142640 [Amborella trichopoda]|uniref:Uncharacterized protein n=1 Tax=Amborella trichopoda TaxID=13333 RepID=W1PCE4_AMBTC|nr:hypothetical protein AMTR_s00076p00142640 [Amborella trichopoda]